MGAINFSIDPVLVEFFVNQVKPEIFIETGTYEGDSTAQVCDFFRECYTIEASEEYFKHSRNRFEDNPSVHVIFGDSGTQLRKTLQNTDNQNVLFWLDAHWCDSDNTSGATSQCPLLTELESIARLQADSIVMIDDARLFLGTPGGPHLPDQWPDMDQLVSQLYSLSDNHKLTIHNDVVVFYPRRLEAEYKSFAAASVVDLLALSHNATVFEREYRKLLEIHDQVLKDYQNLIEIHEGLSSEYYKLRELHESR